MWRVGPGGCLGSSRGLEPGNRVGNRDWSRGGENGGEGSGRLFLRTFLPSDGFLAGFPMVYRPGSRFASLPSPSFQRRVARWVAVWFAFRGLGLVFAFSNFFNFLGGPPAPAPAHPQFKAVFLKIQEGRFFGCVARGGVGWVVAGGGICSCRWGGGFLLFGSFRVGESAPLRRRPGWAGVGLKLRGPRPGGPSPFALSPRPHRPRVRFDLSPSRLRSPASAPSPRPLLPCP